MKTCKFFYLEKERIKSSELNPSMQLSDDKIVETPECSHDPSASPPKGVIGSAAINKLNCAGNLEKCEIPENKRTEELKELIQELEPNRELPDNG